MFGNFDLADYGIEPSDAYEGGGPPVEEADDDEARDPTRVPRDAIESALGSTPAPISVRRSARVGDREDARLGRGRHCQDARMPILVVRAPRGYTGGGDQLPDHARDRLGGARRHVDTHLEITCPVDS